MKFKGFKRLSVVLGSALLLFSSFSGAAMARSGHANSLQGYAHLPLHLKNSATPAFVGGYSPAQVKRGYGIDLLSATGQGQTIAIVDAYGSPTIQNDLNTFDSQFGLSNTTLNIVYPSGPPTTVDGGWALETSMDVEWAHAIAPNAQIMVVVAKTASLSDLLAGIDYATNHGATVVSNSWGGSEFSSESSYDSHFNHSGVTYLASSGDNGAGVSWPAESPYVMSVGGTTLNLDSSGNYLSESGWSGSGGGPSAYTSRPSYQNNWTSVVGSSRGNPDIAFDADPNTGVAVYDSTPYSGSSGWWVVGGTSLGSPSWAALIALANQSRGSNLNSYTALTEIYNIAGLTGSGGYNANYHDITSGSNGYSTLAGYDLVTGIGSPKVNTLIPGM